MVCPLERQKQDSLFYRKTGTLLTFFSADCRSICCARCWEDNEDSGTISFYFVLFVSWVLVQLVDGSCFVSKWLTRWWKETLIELVCFSSVSRLFVRLIGHCFHCLLTRPFVPSFASSWSNPLFVHSFVCSCFRFLKIFGIQPCPVLRNFKHQNHYLRHKILARNFDHFFFHLWLEIMVFLLSSEQLLNVYQIICMITLNIWTFS